MSNTSDETPALSLSKGKSRQDGCLSRLLMSVFFSLFTAAGGFLIWTATLGPLANVIRAAFWQPTPCTIQSSQVVGKDTYQVDIKYLYIFEEQAYHGKDYSFFNLKTSGRAGKESVVRRYPPNSQATCYVNPHHPSESVLNRAVQWNILWGLGGVPFLTAGLIGFIPKSRKQTRRKPKDAPPEQYLDSKASRQLADASTALTTTQSSSEYDDDSLREEAGTLELRPEFSLNQAFFGLLLVTVVWNGIVVSISGLLLKNWLRGHWQLAPDLFVVPFLLVGIVLLYATARSFLAMFNPVPVLVLSRRMIPLGSSATLSWTFSKPAHSIQQLTITLKGIEEARYTRGTNTQTDTAVFYEEVLLETADLTQIATGNVEVRIPTDSMHSLNGLKNKILWKIEVKGSIPRWPDTQITSVFPVVPHE